MSVNRFGQEIGEALPDFKIGELPTVETLEGRYCVVEHLNASQHFEDIVDFYCDNVVLSDWTYLFDEPFDSPATVRERLETYEQSSNPYFFAIRDKASDKVLGTFSLMRIDTNNRSVEMGRVIYAPALQKTRAATEAQYLVMAYVFETLGYRRYEWKCDNLNFPSAKAARRLGFTYEGTFRNHVIYKGRSRDTDWFAMTDQDWPVTKAVLESWLAPENFDTAGRQRYSLQEIRERR